MEINWYGYSCFRLVERGMAVVVTDPFDYREAGLNPLKLKADIVTVSRNLPAHNYVAAVKPDPYVVSGPGEYEVGGIFITAIETNGGTREDPELRNILSVIDIEGLTVAHLGAMRKTPSQAQVEALGPVNIALVPVGGADAMTAAKAAEVINLLEPNIVIPMHYAIPGAKINLDPLSKFLKEMGLSSIETEDSFKVTGKSALPEETRVVILNCKN
ncbi:MAG: MBL fold metallo-hydrolase [Chloroflexi bacterium]|nr:MBL fold metallo-hydrolase [Chloroflexota bacterium]